MPRKKAGAVPAGSTASPGRIHCPACKSEISADGSTLHGMSKYLEELIETAGDVSKLEKALADMEAKHAAVKAQLAKKAEPEVPATPVPEVKPKQEAAQNVGQGKKPSGGSWDNW